MNSDSDGRLNFHIEQLRASCGLLAIACCAGGVFGIFQLINAYHFRSVAVTTDGSVQQDTKSVATDYVSGPYGQIRGVEHDEYQVDYEFKVGSQLYYGRWKMSEPHFLIPPRVVKVYYNREDPNDNRLELPETGFSWFLIAMGAVSGAYLLGRQPKPNPAEQAAGNNDVGTCSRCHGIGFVKLELGGGSGIVRVPCPDCRGAGGSS